MVVRRAMKAPAVVAGAGSIEMQIAAVLAKEAKGIRGKEQVLVEAFATALEVIPRALCDNAGFDATDVLNKLRSAHARAIRENTICWEGVDI